MIGIDRDGLRPPNVLQELSKTHLMRLEQIAPAGAGAVSRLAARGGTADKAPLKPAIENYYLTNPIARASAVMAECARLASGQMLTAAE